MKYGVCKVTCLNNVVSIRFLVSSWKNNMIFFEKLQKLYEWKIRKIEKSGMNILKFIRSIVLIDLVEFVVK